MFANNRQALREIYTLQNLREKSRISREGVSLSGISDAAEEIGMRTIGVQITFEHLQKEAPLPAVIHWNQNHFVVVYKINKKVYVSDPAKNKIQYTKEEFIKHWASNVENGTPQGIALIEPG